MYVCNLVLVLACTHQFYMLEMFGSFVAGWLGLLRFGQSKCLDGWMGVVCIFVRGLRAEFYDIAAGQSKHLDGRIGVVCRKMYEAYEQSFLRPIMTADDNSKSIYLSKDAAIMRKTRAGETVGKQHQRLQQQAARNALAMEKESPEQRQQRLQKKAQIDKASREKQSPGQRQQRLQKKAEKDKVNRENESPEQRQRRLQKKAEKDKVSRENESPEKRQQRLYKNNQRVIFFRESQSPEQWQLRLQKAEAERVALSRRRESVE